MRLAELHLPVTRLTGVGPAVAELLGNLGVLTIADLLLHVPRRYDDRTERRPFGAAYQGERVNTEAEVLAHDYVGFGAKRTLRVYLRDESGVAALLCFGRNFLAGKLPPGMRIRVAGDFQYRRGELQASAFDFAPAEQPGENFDLILPIYPSTEGLGQRQLRKLVARGLREYGAHIRGVVPESLRTARKLMAPRDAVRALHFPKTLDEAELGRRTLAFEELFELQVAVAHRAVARAAARVAKIRVPRRLQRELTASLPFSLTEDQNSALSDLRRDAETESPAARLLQGDVGSGKTLVAFLAAAPYLEAGHQVVFLAPTELLAAQHFRNAEALFGNTEVVVRFLAGSGDREERRRTEEEIRGGAAGLIIGTHATFTDRVRFRSLRFVIVDEQHRFGVLQRRALIQKGNRPDVLYMTATPIPRTLALTAFGDMDTSTIRQMPAGRKLIKTHLARTDHASRVYEHVRGELAAGRQAYFVYPIIERTAKSDLQDAESMAHRLQEEVFSEFNVALIHSRIDETDKEARMAAFLSGSLQVLVATSVVEVGVDVPNATCMVVTHAERFGLASLHQLRGRVGRGSEQSYCFLIYEEPLTDEAKSRLKVMKENADGFAVAEEDLRIRGPGDLSGTRQAGYLRFRVADLGRDMELMLSARRAAFEILENDPGLIEAEHTPLREAIDIEGEDQEVDRPASAGNGEEDGE
jgi:ATP-dependent DNA helicase RecG